MIITIGGLAGTGTTTAADVLSKKFNVPFISAGDIFRQMAKESKMSILEFSDFAENNLDVDIEIDNRQKKLAENSENLIVEGRLSAYFIEADLKVWMITPFDIRVQRICERESKSFDLASEEVKIREDSEAKRYLEIHKIDINNLNLYDLILNTNRFDPDSITEIISSTLKVI
ncbi:MAG: cytidylate kinase family protein [Methanobrevibacter sp.]|jgi:cytidylate kinase|nr:cytidylate kinase family protein [Candidatus Methanovirga basalitermitum]